LLGHLESLHGIGNQRLCPPDGRASEKRVYYGQKSHQWIRGVLGWGYLKRQLASRGSIRRERLPLYLVEYVWRYNKRKLTVEKQVEKLLNLVAKI